MIGHPLARSARIRLLHRSNAKVTISRQQVRLSLASNATHARSDHLGPRWPLCINVDCGLTCLD